MRCLILTTLLLFASLCPAKCLRGDVNGDGIVDFLDASIVFADLGQESNCMPNNLLTFNGTDQYVSVPSADALNFGTGDFTLTVFSNSLLSVGTNRCIYCIAESVARGLVISITASNTTTISIFNDAASWGYSASINTGWKALAYVKSSSGIQIYVDSIAVTTTEEEKIGNPSATFTNPTVAIGSASLVPITAFFKGSLDSLRLYKGVALTAEQVAQIYNGGRGCKYTSDQQFGATSVVSFEFDEGTGNATTTSIGMGGGSGLIGTLNGTNPTTTMWLSGGTPFDIGGGMMGFGEEWW